MSDTGKGISHDFLPYVFDRFHQADASSAMRYGGLGLGLALVKYLYELITTAATGERPDVMVTDLGMPGEDGYSLIRRVREWERERGAYLPAVALTAYGRTEDRMRALKAGFQMHVAKPIELAELIAIITSLIKRPNSGEKT